MWGEGGVNKRRKSEGERGRHGERTGEMEKGRGKGGGGGGK